MERVWTSRHRLAIPRERLDGFGLPPSPMPRRTDLRRILLLGSGPIVIGQACEFDYSGTQACKALQAEGYEVVLVNSNPASIMTDPDMADRTYIEPLTPEVVARVIEIEKPDALLPTMGGQTALNLAVALAENGTLAKHRVELIGADLAAIQKAEDRLLFKEAMERIGVAVCPSGIANSMDEAMAVGATRASSAPPSPSAAAAAALPTTPRNSRRSARAA
jgi:carbamoyl-phosphate synthase large subunit